MGETVSRPLRVLLVHPGASWSTADVYDGLSHGLQTHGVAVFPYRLDTRIELSQKVLFAHWRKKKKTDPTLPRPQKNDILLDASAHAFYMAMHHQVDVVLIISGMLFHPNVIVNMKRAGLRVTTLFTESPYDLEHETRIAGLVDGCWTNERASLHAFRGVNPHAGYLPHGWHPAKHYASVQPSVPKHDVVFVGSGFPERIEFFSQIDWTGIDLGIYGAWVGLGLPKAMRHCIKGTLISNVEASELYRSSRIGLNLYRNRNSRRQRVLGESLSPRAYELASCGVFTISDYRAEVPEVFGDLVPTFRTPKEAEALIRLWLTKDQERDAIAASLPACVAEASWVTRAGTVLADLTRLLHLQAA